MRELGQATAGGSSGSLQHTVQLTADLGRHVHRTRVWRVAEAGGDAGAGWVVHPLEHQFAPAGGRPRQHSTFRCTFFWVIYFPIFFKNII